MVRVNTDAGAMRAVAARTGQAPRNRPAATAVISPASECSGSMPPNVQIPVNCLRPIGLGAAPEPDDLGRLTVSNG